MSRTTIDETGCEWWPLLPSPARAVAYIAPVFGLEGEKRLAWIVILLMN